MAEVELTIRLAEAGDAQAILDFSKRVGQQTSNLTYDGEGIPYSAPYLASNLAALTDSSSNLWLLALEGEDGDRVVGQVTVGSSTERHVAHIGEIGVVVDQDYWGQGLGRLLMEEALNWFESVSPLHRLELRVLTTNDRAVHLYQSLGFCCEGTARAVSQLADGQYLDGYYMAYLKK